MHKLAVAIWHVLHDKVPYRELGADHFTQRDSERAMRRMTKEANSLGMTIRFEPIAMVTSTDTHHFRVRLSHQARGST